jgi:hypothetical protein
MTRESAAREDASGCAAQRGVNRCFQKATVVRLGRASLRSEARFLDKLGMTAEGIGSGTGGEGDY